jgi:hypothetical protein
VRLLLLSSLPLSCALEHYFWALEWMRMRASCSLNEQLTAGCYILRLEMSIREDNDGLAMDPFGLSSEDLQLGDFVLSMRSGYTATTPWRATAICMLVITCLLHGSLLSIFIFNIHIYLRIMPSDVLEQLLRSREILQKILAAAFIFIPAV